MRIKNTDMECERQCADDKILMGEINYDVYFLSWRQSIFDIFR